MRINEMLAEVMSLPRPWSVVCTELISNEQLVEVHVRSDGPLPLIPCRVAPGRYLPGAPTDPDVRD